MALGNTEACLASVLVALLYTGVAAQSGCTNALISMFPCLNYVTGNSSTPSGPCCLQLTNLLQSSPKCLCQVLNGGTTSSLGVSVNRTQALALPSACKVQTPPVSQCTSATPAASPVQSPKSTSTIPPGSGSETVPPTGGGSSAGYANKFPVFLLGFLLINTLHTSIYPLC